ncbi:hypothetical protein EST38_g5721 [Candolleomyces aberdarensis]|uniref:Uncharacterized protein n=1 Tax=Candolleomyces aberdarensis TaxID=2316362 RepID=A0A4Q2DJT0_9AGAR|nr:hypothetical protein EST38_g5721 [Candolleomyces aberdarensis]
MSVAVLAPPQPIIPVIDERLNFPKDATQDHKAKINTYNDMLEDIFIRELELAKLKASLVDMKVEIVEDAQTLDPNGQVILPSSLKAGNESDGSGSSSEGDSEAVETDSASGEDAAFKLSKPKNRKRRGSKGKSKGKGRDATRREEMGKDWDYNLTVSGGARRVRDAEDDD